MNGTDVGALSVLLIFGGPIAAIIIMRVLKHRERLEMIRHGMVPPAYDDWTTRRWYRQNPGMAPPPNVPPPMAGPYPGFTPNMVDQETPERSLQKGIRMSLVGFAIFIGLRLGTGSGPFLLLGLIPMFIGIAQIIIAVLSGAQINIPGSFSAQATMPPPGAPPPYPGARPQPQSQASPYNPGPEPPVHNGFEELVRPVPPPDKR